MHDSHEFLIHLLGNLQDEETPIDGYRFDGSNNDKSVADIIIDYEKTHPSIIDILFSGI